MVLLFLPGIIDVVNGPPNLWGLALVGGALLALPFAYLGFRGTSARRPLLVVVALMLCFWAGPVAIAAIKPESPGILTLETLLGLIMLASPFIAIAGARSAMQSAARPDP